MICPLAAPRSCASIEVGRPMPAPAQDGREPEMAVHRRLATLPKSKGSPGTFVLGAAIQVGTPLA
jgi:hypothetical protein